MPIKIRISPAQVGGLLDRAKQDEDDRGAADDDYLDVVGQLVDAFHAKDIPAAGEAIRAVFDIVPSLNSDDDGDDDDDQGDGGR